MKVKLLKSHTHAGMDYKSGDVIEVNERQAVWLRETGVVEKDKKEPAPVRPDLPGGPGLALVKEKGGK